MERFSWTKRNFGTPVAAIEVNLQGKSAVECKHESAVDCKQT